MTALHPLERLIRRLLRILLWVYPTSFRQEYGRDIEETNLDQYRAARRTGVGPAIRVLAVTVVDAISSGLRERFSSPFQKPSMFYWQDVRYAFRLLRRSPFFTLLTVVVLAGGLGLSIFTLSFLYTAILRPLPLPGSDRIVRIQQATGHGLDAADLALMRPDITTLSGIGALVALPSMWLIGVGFSHYFPIGMAVTMGTGVLVAAIIVGVVLAATYVPTRRALATAILSALRQE